MRVATRVRIAGTEIDPVTLGEAVERVAAFVRSDGNQASSVATINAQFVELAHRDPLFAQTLRGFELNVADGASVVLASRLLGDSLPERVNGVDLMVSLSGEAARSGFSIYLLGGAPGAATQTASKLTQDYPGLRIAGIDCPPFGFHEDPALDDAVSRRIAECRPDIVFVALGAPKQENWIQSHRHLPVKVMIGVGGSFELVAGMKKRAPRFIQRLGCEWAWRLVLEPRRLWKRYLVGNSLFIYLVVRQWLSRRAGTGEISESR